MYGGSAELSITMETSREAGFYGALNVRCAADFGIFRRVLAKEDCRGGDESYYVESRFGIRPFRVDRTRAINRVVVGMLSALGPRL